MSDSHVTENDFLKRITEVIGENLSNEQFGVSELAREISMSRSNLLRKVKKLTGLSVSQFIRQVRLTHAMDLLKQTSLTVAEVSYQVGFNSTSYFIKCFREYYGYPPGEAEKYIQRFRDYTTTDQSIYRHLNMASASAFEGDTLQAIEQLKRFSEEENYHYWILLFLELDPLMDELKALPAFKETMRDIEITFWDRHEQMRKALEELNLI